MLRALHFPQINVWFIVVVVVVVVVAPVVLVEYYVEVLRIVVMPLCVYNFCLLTCYKYIHTLSEKKSKWGCVSVFDSKQIHQKNHTHTHSLQTLALSYSYTSPTGDWAWAIRNVQEWDAFGSFNCLLWLGANSFAFLSLKRLSLLFRNFEFIDAGKLIVVQVQMNLFRHFMISRKTNSICLLKIIYIILCSSWISWKRQTRPL